VNVAKKLQQVESKPTVPSNDYNRSKQLEDVEYLNCVRSKITNDARCTREIKSSIAVAKASFNKKKTFFISQMDLHVRKKQVTCYIWKSIALGGAEA
jgi:hypothetical protein